MRFPAWERMEMATMWSAPMLAIALPLVWLAAGFGTAAIADVALALMVFGLFALLPWLQVKTRARYLTFAAFFGGAALFGVGALFVVGAWSPGHAVAVVLSCLVGTAILSVDLAGTTPCYASYLSWEGEPSIELVEARCTGAADCVQVCPRDVLKMNGSRRKVEIKKPDQCIACGACIVQCPEDALRFRYDPDRVVEAATIRSTRLNLLGRRSISVGQEEERGAQRGVSG